MCQYVENVEQTKAAICEIHLIILRISREINSLNSDFQVPPSPETARSCYNKFTNTTKGTVLIEYKGNKTSFTGKRME